MENIKRNVETIEHIKVENPSSHHQNTYFIRSRQNRSGSSHCDNNKRRFPPNHNPNTTLSQVQVATINKIIN